MSGLFRAVKKPIATAVGALELELSADIDGLRNDLSSTTGAGRVGFLQEGVGAVPRTLQDKARESVSVKDFGAVGDGVTDDTAAIQEAINSGAKYIHGEYEKYLVTTIYPKSNQIICNFYLIVKPEQVQISLRPAVKIGGILNGVVQIVNDLILENVKIHGNRQNISNIYIGNGEDGGMHGFKISDGANGINLFNCEANYCGTAGLAIHSERADGGAIYPIKNIYVENFKGNFNREHGMFADSFDGLYLNKVQLNNNGQTINSGYSASHGNSSFINPGDGLPFGSGFDLECYRGYPHTYFRNFYADSIICLGNSTECMIYAPADVDDVADIPCKNIFIKNIHFEKGTNNGSISAFKLVADSFVGEKFGVDTVHLSGYLDGIIESNNVRGFTFSDGFIKAPSGVSYKAKFNNGKDVSITAPSNRDSIFIETFGNNTIIKDTGVGTLAGNFSQHVKSNGRHYISMSFSVTGGTIAGGGMSWTITLPSQVNAVSANISSANFISGKSVDSNVVVLSNTQVRVFMTPIDDNIFGDITVEIIF